MTTLLFIIHLLHTGAYLAYGCGGGGGTSSPDGKCFVEISTLHHVVWPNINLGRGIVTQFKIGIYPDYPLFIPYV